MSEQIASSAADTLLRVEHLTMRFGGLLAIDDLSFDVGQGAITALIGPNGAGKTTVFNCITGFYKPSSGRLALRHGDGSAWEELAALTDSSARSMTTGNGALFGVLGFPSYTRAERAAIDQARAWLDRVGLTARADDPAGDLPYGAQRRLENARALCTEPGLLCLDEPA